MTGTTGPTPRSTRSFIFDELKRRLVGPLADDEVIANRAYDTYHTGFLSPQNVPIDKEEDEQDTGDTESETGAGESIMTLANLSQQSAMGMSFQIASDSKGPVRLVAKWAEYVPEEVPQESDNSDTGDKKESNLADDKGDNPSSSRPAWQWRRKEVERSIVLPSAGQPSPPTEEDGIELRVIDRVQTNARIITFSIINNRARSSFPHDPRIYQVELAAESEDGQAVFIARPPSSQVRDEEFWNYELLYRRNKELAVGHGCSVEWKSSDGTRAQRIQTCWLPHSEVPKAAADVLEGSRFLDLDYLSQTGRDAVLKDLAELAVAYESWIAFIGGKMDEAIAEFAPVHRASVRAACEKNIGQCGDIAARIRSGIACLKNDSVWQAFCLANQAVAKSMRRSRPNETPAWRAFQLAFILVCLPSAIDSGHEDRKILDLIWFPTGGGKTEAYLGLAALVLFHRRIIAKTVAEAAGTTVLTRYTLRLLTIQQFERATRVICACELVRKANDKLLRDIPITCGLFVGNSATPGSLEEAQKFLDGELEEDGNLTTLPLVNCPWCGAELERNIQEIKDGKLVTPCPNSQCDFHKELPIAIVDEHIYNHPPTMVVGTIDKYARMAWEPRIRQLFGRDSGNPPTLIIQDELHLISDALGTLAALYETAIDYLCNHGGRFPKVIGSTATIRRAGDQCHCLFDRRAVQFPPSGLNAEDSFFYQSEDLNKNPGRLYVGVHAQGRSPKHTLVWAVGTVAQSVTEKSIPDKVIRDPFHTQILYFNSLRELGGALVLAEDDVPRFIQSIVPASGPARRSLNHMMELTGQVPSSQIPQMIAQLKRSLYGGDKNYEPLDLVFSTNMISVGIDVDRLGLMVVNGQPKTTSEYIQATSRIGRPTGSAGLVITLYNWTRPRDRSHYERFSTYHSSFYRYVETVSVTPFSARARDRALHAVLVALSRLAISSLSDKETAWKLADDVTLQQEVRNLASAIVARAESVDVAEANDTRQQLDQLIQEWIDEAEQHNDKLRWSKHPKQFKQFAMLRNPDSETRTHGLWKTPHSMRDVQPPTPVRILTKRQIAELVPAARDNNDR